MALVIEDGSIVSGANSYVTLAEFKAWADARGVTYGTDAAVEAQIVRAMDYIESLAFKGLKKDQYQALQFPRVHLIIDGFEVNSSTIPTELKNAVFEAVKLEIDGDGKLTPEERVTMSETVGSISVTYAPNQGSTRVTPAMTKALAKLVNSPNYVSRA